MPVGGAEVRGAAALRGFLGGTGGTTVDGGRALAGGLAAPWIVVCELRNVTEVKPFRISTNLTNNFCKTQTLKFFR